MTGDNERVINDIYCSIPLADVQNIHVSRSSFSTVFWRKILGHVQGLRYLKFSGGHMPDLAPMLSVDPSSRSKNEDGYGDLGPDQMLVPALEELCLFGMLFPATSLVNVQSLCDALASHKASRGRLAMSNCAVGAYGTGTDFDMVGKRDDGRSCIDDVVEKRGIIADDRYSYRFVLQKSSSEVAPSAQTHDMTNTPIASGIVDDETPRSFNPDAQRDPLSCTPAEILQDVFILLAQDYHKNCGFTKSTIPSWVNVSYVCRHWRNVALNCPTLWTYLFIISPRWTEEQLIRSGQAPLKASISLNGMDQVYDKGVPFMEQVADHAERIQELCLLGVPGALSDALFQGDMPILRKLRISQRTVPWNLFKLDCLTVVKLFDVLQQNVADFLIVLRDMQNLKRLYLYRALTSATDFLSSSAFDTFQKIELPHLSCLRIGASHSKVIALLSCINIPAKTELDIEVYLEDGSTFPNDRDHDRFCSLLTRRYSTSNGQTTPIIRTLVIQFFGGGTVTLAFSASERDCDCTTSSSWGCIPLKIILPHSTLIGNDAQVISDICCSIPLPHVQSIHMIGPPPPSAFWRKMLEHLPDLRYLKLGFADVMPDLASLLSLTSRSTGTENRDSNEYDDLGPDQVLVPALEELELYDVIFSPTEHRTLDVTDLPVTDVQCLYDALASRRGTRGRVTMSQCAVGTFGPHRDFDMVGRWEDGHFHIDSMAKVYFGSKHEWTTVTVK